MFQHQGIWLPDGEKHFPEWMTNYGQLVDGKGTYQYDKFLEAMKWVKRWGMAVDVGAHVGLWSMHLVKRFEVLHAFEPVDYHRLCFLHNVEGGETGELHSCALGDKPGRVSMAIDPADSGGTHVVEGADVEIRTLDSFGFPFIDFLKIDCEGFEVEVIRGATDTILRSRPCIIVEQKKKKLEANYGVKGTPAVDLLKSMGAQVRKVMRGDYILSWD